MTTPADGKIGQDDRLGPGLMVPNRLKSTPSRHAGGDGSGALTPPERNGVRLYGRDGPSHCANIEHDGFRAVPTLLRCGWSFEAAQRLRK
jgi:hypothetical protein